MEQHASGCGAAYTTRRLPVALAAAFEYASVADACIAEKQVQGWSRAKREALIRGDFEALPELARKRFADRADAAQPSRSNACPPPGGHAYRHHGDTPPDRR
jgi:putative endonuclease